METPKSALPRYFPTHILCITHQFGAYKFCGTIKNSDNNDSGNLYNTDDELTKNWLNLNRLLFRAKLIFPHFYGVETYFES